MEVRPPPARLRVAVLAGVAERPRIRRGPIPPPQTAGHRAPDGSARPADLYREQVEGLDASVRSLRPDQWDLLASPADGWTVRDLVAHLTATESLVAERLGVRSVAAPDDP